MERKKLKIGLIMILLFVLFTGTCLAENEDAAPLTTPQETEQQESSDNSTDLSDEEDLSSVISDDLYAFATDVSITKIVDGNAHVFGQNVVIDNQIVGNLLVIADKVTFTENSYIQGTCYILANEVTIDGMVYDLYSSTSKLTILPTGVVYRDMRAMSGTIDIQGRVGRNAFLTADEFTIATESGIRIYGNLEYACKNELTIPENVIEGTVSHKEYKEYAATPEQKITSYVTSAVAELLFTTILFLLMIWLTPKAIENLKETIKHKFPISIGFGLLALILIPIITLLAMCSEFTIGIGIALLTSYILLACISSVLLSTSLAKLITEHFHLEKNYIFYLVTLGIALILWGLKQLPVVSGYITLLIIVSGVGIFIRNLIPTRKKEEKQEIIEEKK